MSIQTDANRFRTELENWVRGESDNILLEVDLTVREVQREVVMRTPIKTGRAKSSWNISGGSPDFSVDSSIRDDDTGTWLSQSAALSQAQRSYGSLGKLSMQSPDLYVSNGVNYIVQLEEGSSKQAAAGFMAEGTVNWAVAFLPVTITGPIEKG